MKKIKTPKSGDWFVGLLCGSLVHGKIQIDDKKVYLCQNAVAGSSCTNKHGFDYSYWIGNMPKKTSDELKKVTNLYCLKFYDENPEKIMPKIIDLKKLVLDSYEVIVYSRYVLNIGCRYYTAATVNNIYKKIIKAKENGLEKKNFKIKAANKSFHDDIVLLKRGIKINEESNLISYKLLDLFVKTLNTKE